MPVYLQEKTYKGRVGLEDYGALTLLMPDEPR
jgi:hypothetical protein